MTTRKTASPAPSTPKTTAVNPMSKSRSVSNPYEVWQWGNTWTWVVLKTYQAPAKEAANPNGRRFCAVASDMTFGSYDLGDVYFHPVKGPEPSAFSAAYRPQCVYRDPALASIDVPGDVLPIVSPYHIEVNATTEALGLNDLLGNAYNDSLSQTARLKVICKDANDAYQAEDIPTRVHAAFYPKSSKLAGAILVNLTTYSYEAGKTNARSYTIRDLGRFLRRHDTRNTNLMTNAEMLAWFEECLGQPQDAALAS